MSNTTSPRTKQLRAAIKRRAKRPVAQVATSATLKAKGNVERRMIRDHTDLLQNIEFVLVKEARSVDDVDDSVVEDGLRAAITHREPSNPTAMRIKIALDGIREIRQDVSDELWMNGLQTVYSSLKRHSMCRQGDTEYLDFVDGYIK